ncbi:MAG: NAD-dependent epimerase/dehydratase family protein [Gemmatimonadetes bacterium]|uniref:NAD-dependent epimerase/dehydratase family protein n=1 Tax=Candidatus Kutchimonas denitrificans TaxID=3056748 RepID=A0AAE4Z4Z0_9BACT|nr:NAD-dependent epimerase/dehydratase family protein [Gemmatimonadota bacterium]NIR73884.1 NAD-dependent epimerase/dehydratase family protein [Candidatus Kutchimonas denitrificans]NIR99690.1 NAD-dependent epimerase/dehydratase family protein [Gemmatimonadota bacterium]NIT65275.1 NAD-dependent epimerase/dehydratase family protein [Gemmatimonadota bacterium]NIW73724.1 NAD-dependent epimerase/dehydratase family protein [Gemmatimonadota bacterium]
MTVSLVTGADGFVGQHLVAELLERGDEVVGAVRIEPPQLTTLSESTAARATWITLELEERESVSRVVDAVEADRVFHLAGLASVAESLDDPVAPLRVNVIGTLYVLEELARRRAATGYDPAVLISGSSQVYGAAAARYRPLEEDHPLEPLSPYAVSKAAQEMLGLQFFRAHGLSVIATRSFNHTGPGQRPSFVAAQLAEQVAEIRAAGGAGRIQAGDVDVRRDFTDVRDVVRAYVDLTERGQVGRVYNVCSGRAYAIRELLETLAELAGVEVEIETDPTRLRRADIEEMVGSYARLAGDTGWAPTIDIRRSLSDLLEWQSAAQDGA